VPAFSRPRIVAHRMEHFLILTFDGIDVQYMTALDKKYGQDVWKTDRTADGMTSTPADSHGAEGLSQGLLHTYCY